MRKTSVNLKPNYEAQPLAGKLVRLMIYALAAIILVTGIFFLVRLRPISEYRSSADIILYSVFLGTPIILLHLVRRSLSKSKENCIEFVNSISDLIKHWSLVLSPFVYMAYCELFDDYYLEIMPSRSDLLVVKLYKFLAQPQNVKKIPLFVTGKPDKRILPYKFRPYLKVPLKTKDFQKWKQQKEKWKRAIAEDEELCNQILTHSENTSLLSKISLSKGIVSLYVAGYDTYFMHPQLKGQSLHGKSLGVSIVYHKTKMSYETFETPQTFNKQLINIGKRILNHLVEGIDTQQHGRTK